MAKDKELIGEIKELRKEVQQLKDVVNMLLGMVVEYEMEEGGDFDTMPGTGRPPMCN